MILEVKILNFLLLEDKKFLLFWKKLKRVEDESPSYFATFSIKICSLYDMKIYMMNDTKMYYYVINPLPYFMKTQKEKDD